MLESNAMVMKQRKGYLFLIGIVALVLSCKQENRPAAIIEHFRTVHAPDKRVALFDIQWEENTLKGETNLPEGLDQLKDSLTAAGIDYEDRVAVLPDQSLKGRHYGVVTLSVANLRSQPKHSAELSTQAILGTPVSVLREKEGWYLIQTPDKYLSWVDAAGIALMDEEGLNRWYSNKKVVFTPLTGHVYADKNEQALVSDLVAGNILEIVHTGPDYTEVKFPDGRAGFVQTQLLSPYEEWIATRSTSSANLIATAKSMMGSPYLWGGTSIKGTDCSGFTKTIFFLNGKIIPRDASQQILEGEEVDRDKNWDNLQVGDLLFFGVPATADSRERVVHVGMWIGDNSFIHSRGRVRISSFDPRSEHYDEYELNRYLRTKRIVGQQSKNVLAVNEIIRG